MNCWKCLRSISDVPAKIGFRDHCPHCEADLHVCRNCRYYSPGKPNDCLVPGTDPIRDREASNFCEEFRVKEPSKELPSSTDRARKLLGLEGPEKKKDFNSLFKDDKNE